jgi:hypothetical protein
MNDHQNSFAGIMVSRCTTLPGKKKFLVKVKKKTPTIQENPLRYMQPITIE